MGKHKHVKSQITQHQYRKPIKTQNSNIKQTSDLEVHVDSVENNPNCIHGPTLLFSRMKTGTNERFFACSAYRNRRDCPFFARENEVGAEKKLFWESLKKNFAEDVRMQFAGAELTLKKVTQLKQEKRGFCDTCGKLFEKESEHVGHDKRIGVSDYLLEHPSQLLMPMSESEKEAQYFFDEMTVRFMLNMLRSLDCKAVVCIGAPRIYEAINEMCHKSIQSLLLDFDQRYFNFYNNGQFLWYNMFNNHFFDEECKETFREFLCLNKGEKIALVLDPPFGGRVEPLAATLNSIQNSVRTVNNNEQLNVAIFFIFPYFMESHLKHYIPNVRMLHYKIGYENHTKFKNNGSKARKFGSPVRIFTNVDPKLISLPENEGYKFCEICEVWVSNENVHCFKCQCCTSKDGRPYVHCDKCNRCVKSSWKHCRVCQKCVQIEHVCKQKLIFTKTCLSCNQRGHKRKDCNQLKSQNKKGKK